jgi:methionyl-tRNA synthetase
VTTYITTTIPYVNARPHLGFALELVQADVLARSLRQRGIATRFQTGTDDNSLKNVLAAQAAGAGVQEFVDANARAFTELAGPLALTPDDVIRTSRDPRHRPGVERLWHACAANGDFYKPHYTGLYCTGCEQFYSPSELNDGVCPEHRTPPELVSEENWFFRLSRYGDQLHALISDAAIRIEPVARRNEVLRFIESGLQDFSVSRTTERARGWGIPVPGDPGQVIYVWWDALANYITSLNYATYGGDYDRWWSGSERRIHLIGKGVLRFHAVYWPAMLLSAGLPLPTDIYVHEYLTAGGRKISKSGTTSADPAKLAEAYGTDAVRWWLLREVARAGDTDFTQERLVARANDELANGLGNLVNRVVSMVHRYRDGQVPDVRTPDPRAEALTAAISRAPSAIAGALERFDFRAASGAIWAIVDEANHYVNLVQPWTQGCHRRDQVLTIMLAACRTLGSLLEPFLPVTAGRVTAQCTPVDGVLPEPSPVFSRLETEFERVESCA